MTDLRKAAEMALEFIVLSSKDRAWFTEKEFEVVAALRQALAQSKQEPVLAGSLSVRYFRGDKAMTDTYFEYLGDLSEGDYTLYTAPSKREWVGLTRRELDIATLGLEDLSDCYKAIEAKLKEKNT